MSAQQRIAWRPGWPWELEVLALLFVVAAIAIPGYLHYMQAPQHDQDMSILEQAELARTQEQSTWQDFTNFFWVVGIVGLYVAHLIVAGASIEWISTPFTHLFSPLLFSAITYYRLYNLPEATVAGTRIVTGSPLEIVCWLVGILSITFLVARIRMARHMLNFRDVDWEITVPTRFDHSYFELLASFRPLVYPPRVYRACSKGILIEGWMYAMPIPFDIVQSLDPVRRAHLLTSGYYLATSSHSLLRIQMTERQEPVFISPADRDAFYQYCNQHLGTKRTGTRPGDTRSATRASDSKQGTKKGATTSGGTRPAPGKP